MRIGILGGTFDPIHFGHIEPALEVKEQLKLDKIWLMPNHIPPHKKATSVGTHHRLAMAKLICDNYDEFELCDIEARRDCPSYSVTTLTELKALHPDYEFYFLMGMDSLVSLPSWNQWQSLFDLCHIVVCQRDGWHLDPTEEMYDEYRLRRVEKNQLFERKSGKIIPIEVQPQPYSSTKIRQQLSQGISPVEGLPSPVLAYIQAKNLYQT